MEFEVVFIGSKNNWAINSERSESLNHLTGLYHLDLARQQLGVSNLSPSRVCYYIDEYKGNPKVKLTEEQARACGFFEFTNNVCIKTNADSGKESFLNKYLKPVFVETKDESTGEIKNVNFRYEPDKEAILMDWIDAGFPTEWGFENPKEEPENYV
jgi:hypothetical protein